jgi:hypothetical protein
MKHQITITKSQINSNNPIWEKDETGSKRISVIGVVGHSGLEFGNCPGFGDWDLGFQGLPTIEDLIE